MGPVKSKPPTLQAGEVNCKSDEGFKLIQVNLDANQNGDGITIATIVFIMVMTVLGLFLLRKLYGMFLAFKRNGKQRNYVIDTTKKARSFSTKIIKNYKKEFQGLKILSEISILFWF